MNDEACISLATDAYSALKSIQSDTADIAASLRLQSSEIAQPAEPELQPLSDQESVFEEVQASSVADFQNEIVTYANMQTVLLVVILAVLLLQLGVNLWQSFSDKWRS